MEHLLSILEGIAPMSQELKNHLSTVVRFKTFSKNEYLLKSGQQGNAIMFLEKGLVRCYYEKLEGDKKREISRWFLKEGDVIVSLSSFYRDKPSIEFIQALEETSVIFISKNELEFIYKNFPEFNLHGRSLSTMYQLLWDDILYGHVMQNAEERYSWLLENHSNLALRVPGKHLASFLGMDEATFSKTKKKVFRE